jgi:hypothetical protein
MFILVSPSKPSLLTLTHWIRFVYQFFMQEMHPDWSVQDIQDMYNVCHGTNGAAPSKNFRGGMMNQGFSMMGF